MVMVSNCESFARIIGKFRASRKEEIKNRAKPSRLCSRCFAILVQRSLLTPTQNRTRSMGRIELHSLYLLCRNEGANIGREHAFGIWRTSA